MLKTKNIVISGTNFWNPGDDFVRDGVIRILKEIFPGYQLNFLFYNFNQDFFPQSKFSGIHNMLAKGDLDNYRGFVDYIVIAGLSAGQEIKDLYNWIIENNLTDRVYLIGAGYENKYVDEHISQEPEITIFKNAKVITSRTEKIPELLRKSGLQVHHINCPAILSVPDIKEIRDSKNIERIAFSIQLPHEYGVINHACAKEMYLLSILLLTELYGQYEIEFIAHHKSEYHHFLNLFKDYRLNIPVIFSSYYQDLFNIYPRYDLVVTTRLHSSLFANGFGIPGIIINDTDRHVHCLKGFNQSFWVNGKESFYQTFNNLKQSSLKAIAEELREFKEALLFKYVNILSEAFGATGEIPVRDQQIECTEEMIVNWIREKASGLEVKKRVLEIFEKLEQDYWLSNNIKNFKRVLEKNDENLGFDTVCFLNWYSGIFKPRTYLEIGVRRGRSMAQVLSESKQTSAVGIDLWIENYSSIPEKNIITDNPGPEFVLTELKKIGVKNLPKFLKGDSHKILPEYFSGKDGINYFDLILVDGDHSYEGARSDLEICIQHLAGGGVLIFDDINHSAHPELRNLWDEIKMEYPEFLLFEDTSGTGTGILIKPPLDKFFSKLSTNSTQKTEQFNNKLPVHFFTIVLNGKPFIEYHINVFKALPFDWHWHIIEGVADFHNDTMWCKNNGGAISNEFHKNGLSNDGTKEYIDLLKQNFPDHITVYRKENGSYWNGKLEMVNAPLENINEECLLWEIDVDELWNSEQIMRARELFLNKNKKTAAYYLCHYFVGEERVTTSINTYGNYTDSEWLRTWRYIPGDKWISHEPPKLCRKIGNEWKDISKLDPLLHFETKSNGLVFLHYAYVLEKNLRFKEIYYGYQNAVGQWRELQKESRFPVYLKNYFDWVKDDAVVQDIKSLNLNSYLQRDNNDKYTFHNKKYTNWQRIVFVRSDAIGDNILASSLLMPLFENYPNAHFTIVCQTHIAELYKSIPFVKEIITFEESKFHWDEAYRMQFLNDLNKINADAIINSMYSNSPLSNIIVRSIQARDKIGIDGDCSNIEVEKWNNEKKYYTHLISLKNNEQLEINRYKEYLRELGITRNNLIPMIWTTDEDKDFAEKLFEKFELDRDRTIALFPYSQCSIKNYIKFPEVLKSLTDYNFLVFGGKEQAGHHKFSEKYIDLCGKTTIRQMTELIRKCKLLIGVDSAGAHIASSVGTPNVIIMGGGHFGRFLPYSNLTSLVCYPLNCYNCNWQCKYETSKCINDIDPELISKAVKDSLTEIPEKAQIYVKLTELNQESYMKWFRDLNSVQLHYYPDKIIKNNSGDPMSNSAKCEKILNNAGREIEKGNLADAKRMLEELLLSEKNNTSVLNDLAVIDILSKEYSSAIETLTKISEIEPGNETAKKNLNYLLSNNFIEEIQTEVRSGGKDAELEKLQRNWNAFGEKDPMWAILTDPKKKDNKWCPGEFFETGIGEINTIIDYTKKHNLPLTFGRALDFGCGIGRLTQALSMRFEEVYGIDIAPSMIEMANHHNRFSKKCKYILNSRDDLNFIKDGYFDFVYTNITLQHMKPQFSKNFIREFMRVLKRGGILIFQIPSRRMDNHQNDTSRPFDPQNPIMEMHGVNKETVIDILKKNNGRIIDIQDDKSLGSEWESFKYCVQKI